VSTAETINFSLGVPILWVPHRLDYY